MSLTPKKSFKTFKKILEPEKKPKLAKIWLYRSFWPITALKTIKKKWGLIVNPAGMWSKISVEFQPNRITGTSQNFEKKAKFFKFLKIFSLIFNFYGQQSSPLTF